MRLCRSLLLIVLVIPGVVLGQSPNAALTGVVDDPAKAVIGGAKITAINAETGVKVSTTTNSSGLYVLPDLPPGTYRLEVDKQGFKGIIEAGLVLHVQDAVEINFHMAIGSMSESVTVTAGTVNINTTDATVSTVMDHELIENMPLNGNSLQTLFELTPGTVTNAGGNPANGGGLSVNGQRPTSNTTTVDGANADIYISPGGFSPSPTGAGIATSASGGTNGLLPVDAVEEFRIQTSTYSAEYGRTPGGQIQVKTRGGTNEYHGSLVDNFRNQVMDAQDWFDSYYHVKQLALRMNDFGGTFGGPILKNRLFFFVAHESLYMNQPQNPSQGDVPDQTSRASAAPEFQPYLNAYPTGNGGEDPNNPGGALYNYAVSSKIRDHTTSVRIDANLPRNMHGFLRINEAPSYLQSPQPLYVGTDQYDINIRTYTGGITMQFSPRIQNELTANYSENNGDNRITSSPQQLLQAFSSVIPLSEFTANFCPAMAYCETAGTNPFYLGQLHQYNLVDRVIWQLGSRHSLTIGADYRSKGPTVGQQNSIFMLSGYNSTPNSLQNGVLDFVFLDDYSTNPHKSTFTNTSLYVVDTWKTTPNLTLSSGLRWDFNPAPTFAGLPVLAGDPNNPASITVVPAGPGTPLYATQYNNIAPRLGFAYAVRNSNRFSTVLRGGGGIFFDTGQSTAAAGIIDEGPFSSQLTNIPYSSFDVSQLPSPTNGGGTPYSLNLIDPKLRSPRTYQWSLTVEQMLDANTALSATYLGNHGNQLLKMIDYNQLSPVATNLYVTTNGGESSYNALQLQLRSRIGRTLNLLASYSYAHALDTGSTDFNSIGGFQTNHRADSDNDIRHIFSSAIHYSPRGLGTMPLLKTITNGWSIDSVVLLQGASPVSVFSFNSSDVNRYNSYADVVAGVPAIISNPAAPGGKQLNPDAFVCAGGAPPPCYLAPPATRNGTSVRNGYRLFGLKQFDLAVTRSWSLGDRAKLAFRVDAFSVLNNPNFSSIDTSVGDNTFGQATRTYAGTFGAGGDSAANNGGLNTVFSNGAARSIQLKLKLTF